MDPEPILASGVVVVLRLQGKAAAVLVDVAHAIAAGGAGAVEITLTTPGARDAIATLAADARCKDVAVGAGTVLDADAARSVLDAGARFVVSPTFEPDVLRLCRDRGVVYMPGAFTPAELLAAWRAGAPVLKLFPAAAVGPGYLRDVLAPLPELKIVPSGGVSLENAAEWIRAGAAAVSIGSALLASGVENLPLVTQRTKELVQRVRQ